MKLTGKKNLALAISEAKAIIDAKAEQARSAESTSGTVMQVVYQHKVEEAYSMASGFKKGAFPLIEAEAEARGIEPKQVAANIIHAVSNWREKMAAIESWRIKAMAEISASKDTREIARLADDAYFPS